MIVSTIFAWILSKMDHNNFFEEALFLSICFSSHLVFDLLAMDSRPPFGIPILWPLSNQYYIFPVLPPIKHSELDHATIGQFLADAISFQNLYVILLEILLTTPFFVLLLFHKNKLKKWKVRSHNFEESN